PIIIEPAEAFGTGTHETTQGCLVLLEQALKKIIFDSRACSLFDIGCGSGIISFAAYRLGVHSVKAIDNDPVAVESAKQNAVLNNLKGAIEFRVEDIDSVNGSADVVVANLDFLTLLRNIDKLKKMFRQYLVVSGVTKPQWPKFSEILQKLELIVLEEIIVKEWGAGLFAHKSSNE
ncbi:MAG: 50S ribosomal protein L11 methyltransferase, partial [Desulfomonilaceae bacterium]